MHVSRSDEAAGEQHVCAGEEAGLSFSLYYAPPELVIAYKEKRRTILADPSADVWALGVRLPHPACMRFCYACAAPPGSHGL